MKPKFIAALVLSVLISLFIPINQVHSQMGGGFTCGVFEIKQTPVFRPYKASDDHLWLLEAANGIQVASTGEVLDPNAHIGQSFRIWMPDFNPTTGRMTGIASYQLVPNCDPIIQFTAQPQIIVLGTCSTLSWSVDNVSNLDAVYLDKELVDPEKGTKETCPTVDETHNLRVVAGWGELVSLVTIQVVAPSPFPPTVTPWGKDTTKNTPNYFPSSTAISTLVVPPPPGSKLELPVVPINQHLDPPVVLSNGLQDGGVYDCYVASVAMILNYYQDKKVLEAVDNPGYRSLVPIMRQTTPPNASLSNDPGFIQQVTHSKLNATAYYTKTSDLIQALEDALKAGNPVLAGTPNGSLLAKQWQGMGGHSIVVFGVHDDRVYYLDPWDGGSYSLSLDAFIQADTFPDGSFLIAFQPVK